MKESLGSRSKGQELMKGVLDDLMGDVMGLRHTEAAPLSRLVGRPSEKEYRKAMMHLWNDYPVEHVESRTLEGGAGVGIRFGSKRMQRNRFLYELCEALNNSYGRDEGCLISVCHSYKIPVAPPRCRWAVRWRVGGSGLRASQVGIMPGPWRKWFEEIGAEVRGATAILRRYLDRDNTYFSLGDWSGKGFGPSLWVHQKWWGDVISQFDILSRIPWSRGVRYRDDDIICWTVSRE